VLLDNSRDAKIEPNAIVTTKSKEFHFERVLLPEIRSKKMMRMYPKLPAIRVWAKDDHWLNMAFLRKFRKQNNNHPDKKLGLRRL